MKSIKFGNKMAHQITAKDWQSDIRGLFKERLNMNISDIGYHYLNEKTMPMLNRNEYKVAINTFGIRQYLLLTSYQSKDYNIFINKKNEDMVIIDLEFASPLYNNTLFDGELVKDGNNKWIYVISDILLYNDMNIRQEYSLTKRCDIMKKIVENINHNTDKSQCKIELKEYFELEYLDDLKKTYIPSIPYKVSGIFFSEEKDYKKSLMYIFPENRTGEQQKKQGDAIAMQQEGKMVITGNQDITKPTIFEVVKTTLPDIYELHQNNIKQGYAGVPDYDTSKKLNEIFKTDQRRNMICRFSKEFNKWIPMEVA